MNRLNSFKIKTIYKEDSNSFRALYSNKNELLRVEKIFQSDQFMASQYVNADIAQIKGLFSDALAPYPGIASNTITCSKEYQPFFGKTVTTNKLELSYFIAYLNSNLTYGSCNKDQIAYKSISVYFYCHKNKQAYHLEIIAPKKIFETSLEDYKNMAYSIKCN